MLGIDFIHLLTVTIGIADVIAAIFDLGYWSSVSIYGKDALEMRVWLYHSNLTC